MSFRSSYILNKLRNSLSEQQNHRCCYCGVRMYGDKFQETAPTIEHVIPRSLGGPNHRNNLVVACNKCNHERGNEIRVETLRWMLEEFGTTDVKTALEYMLKTRSNGKLNIKKKSNYKDYVNKCIEIRRNGVNPAILLSKKQRPDVLVIDKHGTTLTKQGGSKKPIQIEKVENPPVTMERKSWEEGPYTLDYSPNPNKNKRKDRSIKSLDRNRLKLEDQ